MELTEEELEFIEQIREKLGDKELFYSTFFETPESVIFWLEEVTKWDIKRSVKFMQHEEEIDHDVTKLNDKIAMRLKDILKYKKGKKKGKKMNWSEIQISSDE